MERRYGLGKITQTTTDDGRTQVTVTAWESDLPELLDQVAHDIRVRDLAEMSKVLKVAHYSSCAALWLSGSGQGDRCGAPVKSMLAIKAPRGLPLCSYHMRSFDDWLHTSGRDQIRERREQDAAFLAQLRQERAK